MLRILFLCGVIAVLHGCGSSPAENAAIAVDGQVVTRDELAPVLQRFQGDSLLVNLRVESIVNRILILHDARARGLDTLPEMQRFGYDTRRRRLHQSWLNVILEERVELSQDTVEEFYSQLGTIITYTGITVIDSTLCDSLRQLVLSGVDLGDLVEVNSVDPLERRRRGITGPLDRMLVSPEERNILSELEAGELSSVFSSENGWRFLRVDSLLSDSISPLDEIRGSIEGLLLGNLRDEYQSELEDSLRAALNLQMNESIPRLIADRFNEEAGCFDPFSREEYDTPVFTFDGGELSLRELIDLMLDLSPMMNRTPADLHWVDDYCRMIALQEIIVIEAVKLRLDTLPQNVSYLETRISNKLLDIYYDEIIQPRTELDEADLRTCFEENMDILIVPEQRIFEAVGAIGSEQIEILSDIVSSGGEPFEHVAQLTFLSDLTAEGESTRTGPMEMGDIPAPWDGMLFSTDLNETVYCSLSTDRIFVFQVSEVIPSRQATFEESMDEITGIASASKEEEVVTGLVDSLKSIYHIEIDRTFIDGFIYSDSTSGENPSELVLTDSLTTSCRSLDVQGSPYLEVTG